ncbi:Rpn family recombination-promoting nuclease/putative transposase [Sporosarcina obsidiansis]
MKELPNVSPLVFYHGLSPWQFPTNLVSL